jgi:hypothetical protein
MYTTFIARIKKLSLQVHIRQGQCYGIAKICEKRILWSILVHFLEKNVIELIFFMKNQQRFVLTPITACSSASERPWKIL